MARALTARGDRTDRRGRLQRRLEGAGNCERLVETRGAWGVDEDPATVVFAAGRAESRARLVRELDIP